MKRPLTVREKLAQCQRAYWVLTRRRGDWRNGIPVSWNHVWRNMHRCRIQWPWEKY